MMVECNVWCVDNPKDQIDLGLPEGDRWMPVTIDFRKIDYIKLAGENEFIGDDKAVIVFASGNNITIDIKYTEAVKMWGKIK